MKPNVHTGALTMAALIFVLGCVAHACDPHAGAQRAREYSLSELGGPFSADEVALATLVTNEDSLPRPGAVSNDGAIIGHIVVAQARRRGVTVAQYIADEHHRHTRPARANRAWILGLNGELTEPAAWPAEAEPWASARMKWRYRLLEARGALAGTLRLPCARGDTPLVWGGRVDRERIDRMTSSGRWRVADCGATHNVFLARVRAR